MHARARARQPLRQRTPPTTGTGNQPSTSTGPVHVWSGWRGAWSALATEKVRYVGDAVAVVIAETQALARIAAEALEVSYEQLPVAANIEASMECALALFFHHCRNAQLSAYLHTFTFPVSYARWGPSEGGVRWNAYAHF